MSRDEKRSQPLDVAQRDPAVRGLKVGRRQRRARVDESRQHALGHLVDDVGHGTGGGDVGADDRRLAGEPPEQPARVALGGQRGLLGGVQRVLRSTGVARRDRRGQVLEVLVSLVERVAGLHRLVEREADDRDDGNARHQDRADDGTYKPPAFGVTPARL